MQRYFGYTGVLNGETAEEVWNLCNAKLQEYLRWKKPILAYDGEANNFFKNGETALLAKDGDYAPLIERLASDPELCRRIADNAAREIPVYSWAGIAEQFDEYFDEVLSR